MSEENKVSKAQQRAVHKYVKANYDRLDLTMPKGRKEELKAHGLNDSITHVDFMVGTADLSIVGTTHDGREIPVFVDGNFAI